MLRVLVVDDSGVMRTILARALEWTFEKSFAERIRVEQAADGAEGLRALEQAEEAGEPFSLILCDVQMPVMNGLEFLEQSRRRSLAAGVPIVMITGGGGDERSLLATIAGKAHGLLSKPFGMEQMRLAVCSAVGLAAA